MQVATKEKQDQLLQLDVAQAKNELALVSPTEIQVDHNRLPAEVLAKAQEFLDQIRNYDPEDPQQVEFRARSVAAVDTFGERAQREAAKVVESPILDKSIRQLAARGEDGGEIAKSLLALNEQVIELDPSQVDLKKPGGWKRALSWIPGVGKPLARYFAKYQAANTVLKEIVTSMVNGRQQLSRDNNILAMDQNKMRKMTLLLEEQIMLGVFLDQQIDYILAREITEEDPRHKFIAEELLFPLRQRVQDLQQQLAVNQQGVLTYELIIRNNKELIKGVKRAEMVTLTALKIAVAASIALGNQKMVLDILDTVNKTTSSLIEKTSEMLRTQGADIHKRAGSAMIEVEALKRAFDNIQMALDDISSYRQEALGAMKNNIDAMTELNERANKAIESMERGNAMAPVIDLDVASS